MNGSDEWMEGWMEEREIISLTNNGENLQHLNWRHSIQVE